MEVLKFIKDYWVLILFAINALNVLIAFCVCMVRAVKCSLRNDILDLYEKVKSQGYITRFQLEAIESSYKIYKKLKGNSFVDTIVAEVRTFKIVD